MDFRSKILWLWMVLNGELFRISICFIDRFYNGDKLCKDNNGKFNGIMMGYFYQLDYKNHKDKEWKDYLLGVMVYKFQ